GPRARLPPKYLVSPDARSIGLAANVPTKAPRSARDTHRAREVGRRAECRGLWSVEKDSPGGPRVNTRPRAGALPHGVRGEGTGPRPAGMEGNPPGGADGCCSTRRTVFGGPGAVGRAERGRPAYSMATPPRAPGTPARLRGGTPGRWPARWCGKTGRRGAA